MAFAVVNTAEAGEPPKVDVEAIPKAHFKSFKKKWLKERGLFDPIMESNNQFHEQELRAIRTIKRLKEFNDQLSSLCLELSDSKYIPPSLKIELGAFPPISSSLPLSPPPSDHENPRPQIPSNDPSKYDPEIAKSMLAEAAVELAAGSITQKDYDIVHNDVLSSLPGPTSLSKLEANNPHTSLTDYLRNNQTLTSSDPDQQSQDLLSNDIALLTYLDPAQQEEYLTSIDAIYKPLTAPAPTPGKSADTKPNPTNPAATETKPKPISSGEIAAKNPQSSYNWLRAHTRTLGGPDPSSEKDTNAATAGGGGGGGGEATNSGRTSLAGSTEPSLDHHTSGKQTSTTTRKDLPHPFPGSSKSEESSSSATTAAAAAAAKPERKPRASAKRGRASLNLAQNEILDEEGNLIAGGEGAAGSGKGKRKRGGGQEEDGSYRPKGGGSARGKRTVKRGGSKTAMMPVFGVGGLIVGARKRESGDAGAEAGMEEGREAGGEGKGE